jgi:serine/threonine-protein kinase RsbW
MYPEGVSAGRRPSAGGDVSGVLAPVVVRMPAKPGSLVLARQVATGLASVAGMSEECVGDVRVAVTEACTNVVRHAYPDGPPGPMTLSAWTGDGRLMIAVRDEGVGFCDDGRRASGVGLVTIAALAAEVGVRSSDGAGTEIVMAFPAPGLAV